MNAPRLAASLLALASLLGAGSGGVVAQDVASFQAPTQAQPQGASFSAAMAPAPASTPQQSGRILLQFRSSSSVVGATVTLGDLVASENPLPPELTALPVAVSPAFNANRVVSRNAAEAILLGHPEFQVYVVLGADSCVVDRPGRNVSAAELPAILLPELQRATQGSGDVRIEEVPRVQGGLIPTGRIGAQVQLGDGALNHPWATATVKYYSASGELVGTSTVSFRWSWQRTAWVALRPITPGEAYNPIDFTETAVDGIKLGGNFIAKLPDPGELVAAHLIASGAVLKPSDLAPKKIVQKGQSIQVTYRQNNIRISMKGLSLQDGARGETIAVKNTTSQKTIYAKVVGTQEVEIVQ